MCVISSLVFPHSWFLNHGNLHAPQGGARLHTGPAWMVDFGSTTVTCVGSSQGWAWRKRVTRLPNHLNQTSFFSTPTSIATSMSHDFHGWSILTQKLWPYLISFDIDGYPFHQSKSAPPLGSTIGRITGFRLGFRLCFSLSFGLGLWIKTIQHSTAGRLKGEWLW